MSKWILVPSAAELGVQQIETYFKSLKMPVRFSDLGIKDELFEEMALKATSNGKIDLPGIIKLSYLDIIKIYELAK